MNKLYIIRNISGIQVILNLSENATPETSLVIPAKAITKYIFTPDQVAYVKANYKGVITLSEIA